MNKQIVETNNAPAPIGPYSQAVIFGNMLYLSGQIAINPASGELVMDDISTETEQVMQNIRAVLKEAGYGFEHIIKTSIFLSSMDNFNAVNTVYGKYFSSNFPARETVEVSKLPKGVNVEISVVAGK